MYDEFRHCQAAMLRRPRGWYVHRQTTELLAAVADHDPSASTRRRPDHTAPAGQLSETRTKRWRRLDENGLAERPRFRKGQGAADRPNRFAREHPGDLYRIERVAASWKR
jgi:hypothetical protein